MPHQCTNCGRAFDDGSKEMLSGCPDCGGNKFQFHPSESSVPDEPEPDAEPPDPPGPDNSVARTVGSAAATVRDFVSSGSRTSTPDAGTDRATANAATTAEDSAQADARSQVVSPDEIPDSGGWDAATDAGGSDDSTAATATAPDQDGQTTPSDGRVVDEPDQDRPDLTELREELNDQFESIKVVKPGQYELNLMELYDREEYIIALQEDGRYTIQVPETWHE
jgi:predicted  nucleic acid-binding Zn-ribbon protein